MQDKRRRISAWILRSGLAVVFITHGVEAWQLHPHFIDYIIGSGETLGGTAISESTASALLKGIAVLDAIAAVMVVARISPLVIGWLCFWGLVTALARPMSLGIHSYPEVLLRAPHFLAPLALAWLVTFKSRRQISGAGEVRKSESAPDPAAIRDDRPPHAP